MRLNLSTRLILNSLLLSLVPLIIISSYAIRVSSTSLEEAATKKLSIERDGAAEQLKHHFGFIQDQIVTMAEDRMVVGAMKDFREAFDGVEAAIGKRYDEALAANEDMLRSRYSYQESHTPGAPQGAVNKWLPKDRTARILQHYYIAANPYPIGEKRKFDAAADGSRYSEIHRQIHPILRNFLEHFGYYDVFLVDTTGRVVYSVQKEVDFTTNFMTGPYSDSNLATIVKTAAKSGEANSIHFSRMQRYEPSYNTATWFIASPIFDGETKVGVLAFQLSLDEINSILTHDHRWEEVGLGETGESFLVGDDHTLRSESRRLIQDLPAFLNHLKENGYSEEVRKAIETQKTVVKNLEFKSPAVDAALAGKSGIEHGRDLDGDPAIMAYEPVQFEGRTWALITSIEEGEAFATATHLTLTILIGSLVIAVFVALIGWLFARTISRPIVATVNTLSTSSTQMAAATAEQERIATQQAASVNETNTTMEELGMGSQQSARQAQTTAENTQSVLAMAEKGQNQVQEMLHGMEGLRDKVGAIAQQILTLSEQTSQIGTITGLVTDFANETKMLAMNAAVEAVRAGEHGKGFSVLSVEIRKLAEESRRSADRINALVGDVQKATNATVMATEEGTKTVEKTIDLANVTASSFISVAESMHAASESAHQIFLNTQQQAEAVRQVVVAMNDLKTGAREAAAGISQTKDGIAALNAAAQKLKAMT